MIEDTLLVGLVLLGFLPFAVLDVSMTTRAGFDNDFWALPIDDKLDVIAEREAAWARLGAPWMPATALLVAGFTAFTFQLAAAGEAVWGAVGLGLFASGGVTFIVGAPLMVRTALAAATERASTGRTPPWMDPAWGAGGSWERMFVVSANAGYVAFGIAMLRSGFPADWVGWVAIVSGGLLAAWASVRDYYFQHMVLLTPLALGVALVID